MSQANNFLDGKSKSSEIDSFLGPDTPPPASAARKLGDLGLSLAKGVVAVPEAAVGLADLVSGGRAGKAAEDIGVRFKDAKDVLSSFQSDDFKGKQQEFQQADGLLDKAGVAVSNPSLIANAVAESVPLMGAGGVGARGVLAMAPKVGAVGAGALGEGIAGAGSAAEGIRQETNDGLLTPKQSALAGTSGVATAVFGAAGGKAAKGLGIGDVDTMIARGATDVAQTAAQANNGVIRRGAEGFLSEGVLEELPQSLSEQILQNEALGKPWQEGLDEAAVMAVLTGGAMGAGAGVVTGRTPEVVTPPPPGPNLSLDPNAQLAAVQSEEMGEPNVPQTTPPDGRAALNAQQEQERQQREAQLAAQRAVMNPDDEIFASTGAIDPKHQTISAILATVPDGQAPGVLARTAISALESGQTKQIEFANASAQDQDAYEQAALDTTPSGNAPHQDQSQYPIGSLYAEVGPHQIEKVRQYGGHSQSTTSDLSGSNTLSVLPGLADPALRDAEYFQSGNPQSEVASTPVPPQQTRQDFVPKTNSPRRNTLSNQNLEDQKQSPFETFSGTDNEFGNFNKKKMSEEDKRAVLFSNQVVADAGRQYAGTQDGDILNGMAAPFATRMAAARRANMEGKDWTIATVFDGWVARRKDAFNVSAANGNESGSAEPAGPDGNNATASVGSGQSDRAPAGDNPSGEITNFLGESGEPAGGNDAGALTKEPEAQTNSAPTATESIANVQNPEARTQAEPQAEAARNQAPEAVASDAAPAAELPGAGSAAVESDGLANPDIQALQKEVDDARAAWQLSHAEPVGQRLRDATAALEAAQVSQPAQPGVPGEGAGVSQPTQEAKPNQKALDRIAKGTAYFGTNLKAAKFIADNGLKDTHEWVKTGASRFEVREKATTQEALQVPSERETRIASALANGGHVVGADLRDRTGMRLMGLTPEELKTIPADKVRAKPSAEAARTNSTTKGNEDGTQAAQAQPQQTQPEAGAGPGVSEPATGAGVGGATEGVEKRTVESVARAIQQKVASNRRKYREKSRKEREAKGYAPNSTSESEQADYDTEISAAPGEHQQKSATALLGNDPLPLIDMFVNGNFEASEDVFKEITGVRIRGLSAKDKKAALYKWANWTPKQIAQAEQSASDKDAARSEKLKQDDLKSSVMGAWLALDKLQVGETKVSGTETGQEFVIRTIASGFDKAHSQKKGVAPIYGFTDGKSFTTLKNGALTKFVKAAIAFGGLDKTMEYVNPPKPEAPAGFVDRSVETKKPNKLKQAAQDFAKSRADYFTPGNIVNSYGGQDEVLSYTENDNGGFSVKVHAVRKVGDNWVRQGKPQDAHTHSTQPDAKELAKGPVERLGYQASGEVQYSEPRADGKPFPNAVDRGTAPVSNTQTADDELLSQEAIDRIKKNLNDPAKTEQVMGDIQKQVDAATTTKSTKLAPERETITPADDKNIGVNVDGNQLYERKDGSVYQMDGGKPRFSGFLEPVSEQKAPAAQETRAPAAIKDVAVKANTVFTEDAAAAARARLKAKLSRLNTGVDPEMLMDGIILSGYHIEKGARTFVAYARAMIDDLGDGVKPYLKSWYMASKYDPRMAGMDGLDDAATMDAVNLDSLEKPAEIADTGTEETPNEPITGNNPDTGSTGLQGQKPGELQPDAGTVRRGNAKSNTGNASRGTNKNAPPDYVPAAGALTREGSWFETAKRNIDLIELAIKIEAEKRPATPEEQAKLSKYVGFGAGAIRNELFPVPPAYAKSQEPNRLIWPQYVRNDRFKPLAERIEALPREWQQSILQSSQYAHYTSEGIIRSVWSALQRMGFNGGQVFEPGMGIGSFSMLMPDAIRAESRYTGVEFDAPTALIAKLLSPQQNMLHGDFIKGKYPKNFFDVNVGNPPFSQTKIFGDPEYAKKGFMLHDFFFAKGIDLVRPGGIQVFVTSKGTMDKQTDKARKYLSERADLLGAIRLPSTAFEDNAGTSVVTDVIFLRKRLPGEAPAGESWAGTATVDTPDGPVVVNEYFAKHPEMVLGQQRISGNTDDQGRRINSNGMGGEKYTVVSYDATPAELEAKFAKAIEKLPEGFYSEKQGKTEKAKDARVDFDPTVKREGVVYLAKDGTLMRVAEGVGVPLANTAKLTDKDQAWFKSYVGLRELVQDARFAQLNDGAWEAALSKLNKAYDKFVKEHGHVLDYRVMTRKSTDEEGNVVETESRIPKNRRLLREDYDQALVTSLESISEDGSIVKSPFLKGRTIGKPVSREVKSIGDALAVSLDETGSFDLVDVGRRLKLDEEETIEALGNQIYQTPDGVWQLADEYLAGDVVAKLEEAEAAARINPDLKRNVEALKEAQPEKLGPAQISAKLGASWIPESHVDAFSAEIGAGQVTFDPRTETWQVDGGNKQSGRMAGAEYGTAKRSPSELLEAILNSRSIKITQTIDKKTVPDQEGTTAANEMAKKIKDKFRGWIWTDTDRATELVESYNKNFNNLAPRKFDGSHLTLPGVSLRYKLHPHQLRAIWRMVQTGNTYLAHAVGAGKTIEMIAGGMEQKRLGLIKKPMYVVPNHMLEQFSNEFMELYPLANIMVADDENFSPERRKAFIASATLNNPDAIVITHDAFQRIGVKEESVAPIRDEILADLEIELSETAKGNDTRVRRGQLEQQIEAVKQRFDRIIGAGAKDSTIKFEDMGVDFVFADEAHVFRKLDFHTAQQIKGIDPNGSKRALDMYVKTRILDKRKPGRSMVFASGTPVTNTMGELYTIMRFFAGAELDKSGISTFDAWARQFGEVAPALEPNAAGKYELIERFAKFDNVPELMSRVRQFMDVLTSDNLGALVKRPNIIGGKPNLNIIPTNSDLTEYMKGELARRIEISRAWKPSKDEPHNPDPIVAIITDGRFAAIDPRFFGGTLKEGDKSIITEMGDKVVASYHATKNDVYLDKDKNEEKIKGSTQIVFYNLGFGEQSQKSRGFNSRAAFTKRLTDGGIPRAEIAWFDDANSDAKKEAVFKAMRNGTIKVLIGSAKKMGTGVNVQKRLAVLHYQDPPWFPADVEQPHGRILRQGNQNEEIAIEWYTTKGTYQSTMWQMVGRKQRFIDQAFTGDKTLRSMDDLGEASLFEQAAAVASGDPRAIQLAGLKQDVERFTRLQAAHANEQINVRSSLNSATWQIEYGQKSIRTLEKAFKAIGEKYFSFTAGRVNGRDYMKPGEFGQAIKDEFNKVAADSVMGELVQDKQIASLGAAIKVTMDAYVGKDNKPDGTFDFYVEFGGSSYQLGNTAAMGADVDATGLARRIFNKINEVDTNLQRAKRELAANEVDANKLRKKLGAPFEYQQEMAEKYGELKRLEAELEAEGRATPAPANAPFVVNADGTANGEDAEASTNLKQTGAPEANESDVVFSRPTFSRGAQSQANESVERLATGIASHWENAPKVVVAFDLNDPAITENVRKEDQRQRSGGATGAPEGFYYKGTVYLMSSKLGTPNDIARVLFHEALGHYGLRGTFGKALRPILRDVAMLRRAEVDAKIKQYGLKMGNTLDRFTAAEEVLAELAQTKPEIGFVQRAIAAIRTWLRENVPGFNNLRLTDAELIRNYILPARAFVENGRKQSATANGAPAFALKEVDGKSSVLSKDGKFQGWPKFNTWTRAEYKDVVSLLPKEYRYDSYRREPLPTQDRDARTAAALPEIKELNSGIGGAKGFGVDGLGNIVADMRDGVSTRDLIKAADIADKHGLGVFVTGVRTGSIPGLMDAGFVSEMGLGGVLARVTKSSAPVMPMASGVVNNTAYGTMMAYKPRGFAAPMFSRGTNDPMTNNDVVGNQGGRSADDTTPSAGIKKPMTVNPTTLVFRESEQNRKDELTSDTDEFDPIVVIDEDGELSILDGHNRASVAIDRGDSLKAVKVTKDEYDRLQEKGFEDGEIAWAALQRADQSHAAGNLDSQFPGSEISKGGDKAWDDLIENESTAPDSGGVMFSRTIGETLTTAANNVHDVTLPAGYTVGDMLKSAPGKLNWWHKTVGTMYNLAERSPAFKRVFDGAQSFINDVSYYATEAADLAPTILPKLETWKDIAKSPLSVEDTKAISAPIFEGTLIWARDEAGKPIKIEELEAQAATLTPEQKAQRLLRNDKVSDQVLKMWQGLPLDQYESIIEGKYERDMLKAGVVWTPAELRAKFNLTGEKQSDGTWDGQIGLYQEFRKATDKSLTNLAISDMLRFGGKDVEPIRNRVLSTDNVVQAGDMLRDYLLEMSDMDPARKDVLLDTANKMVEKSEKAKDLIERGYAPLSRYGQYTLDVVSAEGERVYFSMFESRMDAARARRNMEQEYPGATITQGTVSEEEYKLFAGVSPETLELFGDMLGLEAQGDSASAQAFQTYLKLAKSNRSSMKRLIQRKGIAGFNEDAGRVLAGFVYSNARQTSSNLHMGSLSDAANTVAKQQGELKDQAVRLVDYIKNPREEAQALRGLLFAQYIGGSVASAMVNMTQPLTMTFPWLSQYGGVTTAAKQMAAAVKDSNKKLTGDARLDAALKRAEEDGTVSPQEIHQLMQQSQGKGALQSGDGTKLGNAAAAANNTLSRISVGWGKLFSLAEQFNRRVTFIAAYRTAVAQGMADPDGFARKAIAETQGIYNKGNKPAWARGAVGSTLFTFKQYSISYMEMLHRMATQGGPEGKKAALLALGVLFLLGGAGGFPGADDLDDLISGILQRLGYNFDSKQKRKEFFAGIVGEGGAQFLERGISGLPGVPLDVSGRMGMGNLLPGTGLLTKKTDYTRDVAEIAGPAGDFVKRGFNAAGKVLEGNIGGASGAVSTLAPKAVQNLYQAYDMANMGMYRDAKGMKVLDTDGGDAVLKAIGFQPNDVKKVQDASFDAQRMIGLNKLRETEIANRWAQGIFEKDTDKVKAAREELAEWNATNADSPIRINFKQILQRVQKMNQSKAERITATAPKEIRADVRRALEVQ